uniref:Uncharacterized protein n=1 Tax=candidate division CPR3 bacterium TaxID=2268181 RepID=A0A7V3N4W1_UNCC3
MYIVRNSFKVEVGAGDTVVVYDKRVQVSSYDFNIVAYPFEKFLGTVEAGIVDLDKVEIFFNNEKKIASYVPSAFELLPPTVSTQDTNFEKESGESGEELLGYVSIKNTGSATVIWKVHFMRKVQ